MPSQDNAPYSVRIVDQRGKLIPELFGEDIGVSTPLGTGNPADDGVGYGTMVKVTKAMQDNMAAQIRITPPTP